MRIIRVDGPELKVKHRDCGALIAYYPNEVLSKTVPDYGGGRDTVYYILCPHCGKQIEVRRP